MEVRLIFLSLFPLVLCENNVKFVYGRQSSFKEELIISNVTSDAKWELGYGVRKWKTMSFNGENYAIGMGDVGINLLKTRGDNYDMSYSKITEEAIRILDVKFDRIWNGTLSKFEPVFLILLEGGSLSWFNLEMKKLLSLELDQNATQFDLHQINGINYLFVLINSTVLEIFKIKVMSNGYKFLWSEQKINLESPTKSFIITNQNSNHFLSITQPSLNHIKIYEKTQNQFELKHKISNSNSDRLVSFSIGPKSYLLTNGESSSIYKFTKNGPVEEYSENEITNWLPIPIETYRDEIFILAQKEVNHDSHKSHSIELIHSSGFAFEKHHEEIPCFHFKHHYHGLDCLVEEEEHHVDFNASAVIPFENSIGLLITTRDLHTQLFIINVDSNKTLHPREARLNSLMKMKEKLKEMQSELEESKKVHIKAKKLRESYEEKKFKENEELTGRYKDLKKAMGKLKKVASDVDKNDGFKLKKLAINGDLIVEKLGDVKQIITEKLNNENTLNVFNDIVKNGDGKGVKGKKKFAKSNLKNLKFDFLNNINTDKLIFMENSTLLQLKGNVEFYENLQVSNNLTINSKTVNDINLNEDMVYLPSGKTMDNISIDSAIVFENLDIKTINSKPFNQSLSLHHTKETIYSYFDNKSLENLSLESLKVNNINSKNITDILDKIVLTNKNSTIPGIVEIKRLDISNGKFGYLNDLKYPENYVLTDSNVTKEITGTKNFEEEIRITSLEINDLINKVKPSDIFDLNSNQTIDKPVIFKHIDAKENYVNQLGLNQNDTVDNLEIEGVIIVGENMNNVNIDSYLKNFVWKNASDVELTSVKSFQNLSTNNLIAEKINNIFSNQFIDKISNQNLNLDYLGGNITVENLYTNHKIDEVDIQNLLQNSIKLSENQEIPSTLTFLEDLEIRNLNIVHSLNELKVEDFINTKGEKYLENVEKLSDISIKRIEVKENVFGKIEGFDVKDFEENVWKITGNQDIFGEIKVDELNVQNLNISKINDFDFNYLFNKEDYITLMENKILDNRVLIKNLNVQGNLTVENLNNIPMNNITNSLTFTKDQTNQPNITFMDNVHFNKLGIKNFNGVPFEQLIDNLIFKNQTKLQLHSPKVFLNNLEILRYIETNTLNGIKLENILRKGNKQKIQGEIIVTGNVTIENELDINNLNGVQIKKISELLVEASDDLIHMKNDVEFLEDVEIEDLVFGGFFNEENLSNVLENAIGVNDDIIVRNEFKFMDKVVFENDLDIAVNLNGIDFSEEYKNIVHINEEEFIEGITSFEQPVEIKGVITVESDLLTKTIMGIDPQEWRQNGVFINNGFIPGEIKFENITVLNHIETQFLNNMNASNFIPLNTDKKIPKPLTIDNLKVNDNFNVNLFVNSLNLSSEYKNTVLNKGIQNITSKINFKDNVLVYENLEIKGSIGGYDFDSIVFTNENRILKGNYEFVECKGNDLNIRGFVNGINFDDWVKNGLMKNSNRTQEISKPIKIKENLVINNYSYGNGLISGLNLRNISDNIAFKDQYKNRVETGFVNDYKSICNDVNHMIETSKNRIYKFKYLEFATTIILEKEINFMHYFEHNNDQYLLVNEKQSCNSKIFQWVHQSFVEITKFETGKLDQIIVSKSNNDELYLLGRSSNCSLAKTNLWIFDQNQIQNRLTLEDSTLLQESLIPNTFFGLNAKRNEVKEFKITQNRHVFVQTKWKINTNDNMAFIPRGLGTGPALRDGQRIISLSKNSDDGDVDFDYDTQETMLGEISVNKNRIIPGKNSEIIVFEVGKSKKKMVAVSRKEGSSIKTKSDSINVYSDAFKGTLFNKIPAYKPSSITPLNFGNAETLLIFFEDQKTLQIYTYKGMEGFKYLNSAKMNGKEIIHMKLRVDEFDSQHFLAILNENEITVLKVVMEGRDSTKTNELFCEL